MIRMQKNKTRPFAIMIATTGFLWMCAKQPIGDGTTIATSIAPIADITQNIAGNSVNVICAVPPNANPHTYEPDPSTAKALRNAVIFVGVHPQFDGWILKMISPVGKKFYLSDIVKAENPHIWLSVKNAKIIASAIREFLAASFPDRSEIFAQNFENYQKKLEALDVRIGNIFSNVKQKKFFQWHPAWDYFAADYGLTIVGTVESGHGDSPSIKEIVSLKKRAQAEKIKVVVIDYYDHNKTADAFVREIGGKAVRLDGIGDPTDPARANYLSLMEYNAQILAKALSE